MGTILPPPLHPDLAIRERFERLSPTEQQLVIREDRERMLHFARGVRLLLVCGLVAAAMTGVAIIAAIIG